MEVRVINSFVVRSVVVPSVVMPSDSDDSSSLSGSESDLDFDDVFGESSDEESDFEGFVNNEIPAEIQRQWSRTADNNRDDLSILMQQMLVLQETTGEKIQPSS